MTKYLSLLWWMINLVIELENKEENAEKGKEEDIYQLGLASSLELLT